MTNMDVSSYLAGRWIAPDDSARSFADAASGAPLGRAGALFDAGDIVAHARAIGGPNLRALSFHDRARMLKALALYLEARKEALYTLSYHTGATLKDHAFDIDGGIGTTFVFASKGRREMPDAQVFRDGPPEHLSRDGSFLGQHICLPLQGVAVHINAFNFPVWGMLEKLAPTLLAGVPAIVKPATATAYVTEAAFRMMIESGILPQGAVQLVAGGVGDLLDHLGAQDVVSFTGSAQTALKLRSHGGLLANATRFIAEQDSLNASVLGPDAAPGTPEFDLFVKEVHREMTTKAGQKCTAIRRIMAPRGCVDAVAHALKARLEATRIGDPRDPETRMGALVSRAQRTDVLEKLAQLAPETDRISGDPEDFELHGASGAVCAERGAFVPPILLHCANPDAARAVHETEAFGPVATLMPYDDPGHASALLNRGGGSLVASLITHDPAFAREMTMASAPWHGRLYINDRTSMAAATGHGAPMPHMVHGGPGRAGGGEELGGIRAVKHYMQRTALQGSPDMIAAITGTHIAGATTHAGPAHPFTRDFDALTPGETLETAPREVTLDDIAHFAEFTGDTFYAHMDEAAAARNPFFPGRVAHGYLLLSFAAGLFVEPNEGPVLANTGLDALRFLTPVVPGDHIRVRLTVKDKTPRVPEYGEVRWQVVMHNQRDEAVAEYELLTMVARAK